MKRALLMVFTSLLSISSYAMPAKSIDVDNLSMVKLNDVQENRLTIKMSYAGKPYSGSCSIVVRTRRGFDDTIVKLSDKFNFIHWLSSESIVPDVSTRGTLIFPLQKGSFVDGITIETKDGKSIAENISSFFHGSKDSNYDVGALTGICA